MYGKSLRQGRFLFIDPRSCSIYDNAVVNQNMTFKIFEMKSLKRKVIKANKKVDKPSAGMSARFLLSVYLPRCENVY